MRISIHLPYLLALSPGEYLTPGVGGVVFLADTLVMGAGPSVEDRTEASSIFDVPGEMDAKAAEDRRRAEADRLLHRVNHVLRWYRVITNQVTVIELTRAQASPFHFTVEDTGATWGGDLPLNYEAGGVQLPTKGDRATFAAVLREGLSRKTDPDVAALNLLDAEYAVSVGRFREAVLLCWGAIDSTFVRKFKRLVDERLTEEWADGREFLKGIDFGLRHKMTTGLRLLTGRALHSEPDGFWQELSISYGQRNKIIHEGHIAHEDDAKRAIRLARKLTQITASLP